MSVRNPNAGFNALNSTGRMLRDIDFPEFTAHLITDTFNALLAAHFSQTEAYAEFLSRISKDLTTFINETKDEIDGSLIEQFLIQTLKVDIAAIERDGLTSDQIKSLNDATKIPDVTTQDDRIPETAISAADFESNKDDKRTEIFSAIAKRVAADKYTLLKDMAKIGLLRLVVNDGTIETKLTFQIETNDEYSADGDTNTNTKATAYVGLPYYPSLFCRIFGIARATKQTKIQVQTINEKTTSNTQAKVDIYGRVQINFKTDYLSLDTV